MTEKQISERQPERDDINKWNILSRPSNCFEVLNSTERRLIRLIMYVLTTVCWTSHLNNTDVYYLNNVSDEVTQCFPDYKERTLNSGIMRNPS